MKKIATAGLALIGAPVGFLLGIICVLSMATGHVSKFWVMTSGLAGATVLSLFLVASFDRLKVVKTNPYVAVFLVLLGVAAFVLFFLKQLWCN